MLRTCVAAAKADGAVCVFLEPIALYHTRDLDEAGDELWLGSPWTEHVPIGAAYTHRGGDDLTIVTWGNGLYMSLRVARRLQGRGIGATVVDLRWLAPLPLEEIVREARASGRTLVVDETRRTAGVGEGIVAELSVLENIVYGRPRASREDVERAARSAHAAEFIERLPEGYDTLIGERGAKLSGGQKQRLALARVFLADPRVLILDEATSALDSESEQLIQRSLSELMKGRTSIVIAHRLSTIFAADRIIVLSEGRIVQVGSHAELSRRDGLYSRLYQAQRLVPENDVAAENEAHGKAGAA